MVKEICQDCGKVFLGGPKAFLCAECRRKRTAAKRGRDRERRKRKAEALERVITHCGDIAEFTFREMPAEKKEALAIIHRWVYRVKKIYGAEKEWGIRWGLLQNTKGNYYMDVMFWGAATDGRAENEWKDKYGLTKTLIKVRDQAACYDAEMWEIRQSQYEITGGTIWWN